MNFVLKPPRRTQALSDSSFSPPPLDGSLTVPQLYDWHYDQNPNHPVFVHSNADGDLRYYPFSEVIPAAHRAGRYIANVMCLDLKANQESIPVVAIVATSDTITFFTTLIGTLRAGIPVFPISPRYSANVIAHLLSETKAACILVSDGSQLIELVNNAVQGMQNNGHAKPLISLMPKYEQIFLDNAPFERLPTQEHNYSATTIIVHSSGTKSLPRPIRWNARRDLQTAICPWFSEQDLCGALFGCQSLELFHGLGLCFLPWLAGTGLVMATLAPENPAIAPDPEKVFQSLLDTKPSHVVASPRMIQTWARDSDKVMFLSKLTCLAYAGSHLNKLIGDYLIKQGVRIYTIYGLSEAGSLCQIFSEDMGNDWEYFTVNSHCSGQFIPTEEGTYELIVLSSPTQELAVTNMKYLGVEAYATHDVFLPHPLKPRCWKILGRLDDQIMLATGETTNPGPLEDILCQHPEVKAALMFGRARPYHGVLIELKEEFVLDPQDKKKLDEFRDRIWPKVDEMNTYASRHSRISKEMVIVVRPMEPFIYNSKGLPDRAVVLHRYQEDIDALYFSQAKLTT